MPPKYRSQPTIQTSNNQKEDYWYNEFEKNLTKTSVQSREVDKSLFDQIQNIMDNGKSNYKSVQSKVDDMMQRSGLTSYLEKVKVSKIEETIKTAQNKNTNDPKIIHECPQVKHTLENIINDTKGNIPVPAIISRLHALHSKDIADESAWEDENLIRLVSRLNLEAKKNNPNNYNRFNNLGLSDRSNNEIDQSNTDAFHALQPHKV